MKNRKKNFKIKVFTLLELKNYIEEIKYTKDYKFSLRVPEATLRDNVKYKKDIICSSKNIYEHFRRYTLYKIKIKRYYIYNSLNTISFYFINFIKKIYKL